METLFDREYQCQICENTFKSKHVKTSAIKPKKRDKDFHAYYVGDNPTHYGVICCPYCGFAQFESDFNIRLTEGNRTKIKNMISGRWRYQNFSLARNREQVIQVHLIALANYKVIGTSKYTLGKLYLRLAWCYRELENKVDERKYLALSLDAFMESFTKEDYSGDVMRELEITYIIGELSRQLENFTEAVQWFQKVVYHPEAYRNRMIKQYARDQWNEAAEANRNRAISGGT